MSRPRPPRLATGLLRLAAPREDRAFVLADAREEYARLLDTAGRSAARAWYWQQALGSIRPLLLARWARAAGRLARTRPGHAVAAVDLAQALRWIRRHPGTASTAWATLAIAFSAALATWTIVHAVVLRPLPFPGSDRIVSIRATGPGAARGVHATSLPDFEDWREQATAFEVLSAWAPDDLRFTGPGAPQQVPALRVAAGFDRALGLTPHAGRFFVDADYAAVPHVAVVTHAFWRHALASDPAAVGRLLRLNDRPYEIVGILPDSGVQYPLTRHGIWIPLVPRDGAFWETQRGSGWVSVVGRVRPGITVDEAASELTGIVREIARQYPRTHATRTLAELTPLAAQITGPVAPILGLLAAALAAVLVIAGGNIANLLLASTAGRRREFALRSAIGAGRARLAGQVLSESFLLCGAGSLAALALAPVLVRAFLSAYPGTLPRAVPTAFDPSTIPAAVLLTLGGGLLLGLPLVLRTRDARLGEMAAATPRATEGIADRTFRTVLVAGQVALSFVLIVAGAGFVLTLDRLRRVDQGYDSSHVLVFSVPPPASAHSGAAAVEFYAQIVDAIAALPGVRSAAAAVGVPRMTGGWRFGIRPPGADADVLVAVNLTTAAYFDTLGIRRLEGRLLTPDEQRRGTAIAVVNAPLASLLGGRVVGRRLSYSGTDWEIVGVVEGTRHERPRDEPTPELFIPWHMAGRRPQTIVVRTSGDPLALLPAATQRVHAIDPTAPISDAGRLDDRVATALAAERFRASVVGALALIAVLLAALGTYSVTACAAARRTREYGIRLALGERPGSIAARALMAALGPAAAGVVAGAILSYLAAGWIQSFLYGVRAASPLGLTLTSLVLVGLAAAAGAASARRAARIDPVTALATE